MQSVKKLKIREIGLPFESAHKIICDKIFRSLFERERITEVEEKPMLTCVNNVLITNVHL